MSAVTITVDGTTSLLLLAVVPFLVVCAVFMLVAVLYGPRRGAFTMALTWPWTVVTLPTLVAGLWGIARVVAS